VFVNALCENLDNVTVIGSVSYGKGIGQTEMKLLGGYGIKATTLQILTPKGNSINHTGIQPDLTPEEDEDALEYTLNLITTTEEQQ
jgi:carboxyl-terminal processing protease